MTTRKVWILSWSWILCHRRQFCLLCLCRLGRFGRRIGLSCGRGRHSARCCFVDWRLLRHFWTFRLAVVAVAAAWPDSGTSAAAIEDLLRPIGPIRILCSEARFGCRCRRDRCCDHGHDRGHRDWPGCAVVAAGRHRWRRSRSCRRSATTTWNDCCYRLCRRYCCQPCRHDHRGRRRCRRRRWSSSSSWRAREAFVLASVILQIWFEMTSCPSWRRASQSIHST